MKYYSDITKKLYDTTEELEKAEKEIVDKNSARKADAEKVDKAYKEFAEARKNYNNELYAFCKKHGAYHKTIKDEDINSETSPWDIFSFFNIF